MDANLSIATKRVVYEVCVLSLLLYCSECWVTLQQDITALSTFHFRCIRSILGITRQAVWSDRITNTQVLAIWNDTKQGDIPTRLLRRRMEWLGHVARMDDDRTPRQLLFGSLLPTRPACGPRKRSRDAVRTDIRHLHLEGDWFDTAQQQGEWRTAFRTASPPQPASRERIQCSICNRSFSKSRQPRHKCTEERRKPVADQAGSRQCTACLRWFRSPGGLAVHKYLDMPPSATPVHGQATAAGPLCDIRQWLVLPCCRVHCSQCDRCCKSTRGFQLHNCNK